MKEYESYLAVCPYYKAETADAIRCEAPIEGVRCQVVHFRTSKRKGEWHEERCCREYRKCPYAKVLEEFWRGKE